MTKFRNAEATTLCDKRRRTDLVKTVCCSKAQSSVIDIQSASVSSTLTSHWRFALKIQNLTNALFTTYIIWRAHRIEWSIDNCARSSKRDIARQETSQKEEGFLIWMPRSLYLAEISTSPVNSSANLLKRTYDASFAGEGGTSDILYSGRERVAIEESFSVKEAFPVSFHRGLKSRLSRG